MPPARIQGQEVVLARKIEKQGLGSTPALDAKSEKSILILLDGPSNDVQIHKDLDNFSPIEGGIEVAFIFNQHLLILAPL